MQPINTENSAESVGGCKSGLDKRHGRLESINIGDLTNGNVDFT